MTVHQLEQDGTRPRSATLAAVQRALELAGAQLHLLIVLACVQRVEIEDTIRAEDDGLAVKH